MLKLNYQYDANFVYYLLKLLDGKFSYADILSMDYNLLMELKRKREEELEAEIKQMKKAEANAKNSSSIPRSAIKRK